jgi:hypothetical protein
MEERLKQAGKAALAGQAKGFMLLVEDACTECRSHLFQNKRLFSFAYMLLLHKRVGDPWLKAGIGASCGPVTSCRRADCGRHEAVSGYNPTVLRFAKRTPTAFPAVGASH